MAPGETLQLNVSALTPTGQPFSGDVGTATFWSSDTTKVFVDANGLLTAREAGGQVQVVASIRSDTYNVTNADTAYVLVTPASADVASFSIAPPDSTILGAGSALTLTPTILDSDGDPVDGVLVRYGSLDPSALYVDPLTGALDGRKLGKTKIWAEATVYGVTQRDTVEITVTYPVKFEFDFLRIPYYDPNAPIVLSDETVTVRVNATVTFWNATDVPISVTFDHTDGIVGGNVPAFVNDDGDQDRKFVTPGTYKVTSSMDHTATIIVVP
jgi:hypothetical protein